MKHYPFIDTSDWSIAVVDLGSHTIEDRTLYSEDTMKRFCEKHGYKLISFTKGTNRYCG